VDGVTERLTWTGEHATRRAAAEVGRRRLFRGGEQGAGCCSSCVVCWMPWTKPEAKGERIEALFGGERARLQQDEAGQSRTSQDEVSARAGVVSHKPRRA
jgi:hypothetical protein